MRYRILVVEDNALNRELLCDWLEIEGYEVLAATDLNTAFALIEQHRPHAVLLDIQLGSEDGLSLAGRMRQQPATQHVPVIAVTAHALLADQNRILQAGCNAWIPKPVDFKLLREHLERWLSALRLPGSER